MITVIIGEVLGLELNRLNQVPIHAPDANFLGENFYTIKNNAEIILQSSKEIGLQVNINKTKMLQKLKSAIHVNIV
jgi:hypothetical protein